MNESGQSVASLMRYFAIEPGSVLVVHDDLDLEPGVVRLKRGRRAWRTQRIARPHSPS